MKRLTTLIFILTLTSATFAQQLKFPSQIKVILLGTFHFGETGDKNKITFGDLFSPKRQSELDQLARQLVKIGPKKIFVEATPEKQHTLDSLYSLYRKQKLTDTVILRNEIEQIGFRLANLAGLPAPRAVDFRLDLPYGAMSKFEKGIGADTTLKFPPFFDIPYPFTDASQKLSLKNTALPQYFIMLNNEYHRKQFQFDYLHYAMGYGYKSDYTGADYTSIWYERNLKIYTNILRELQPADDCIVVIFGSSHTNTLRQFFENHPSFKPIELQDVIK